MTDPGPLGALLIFLGTTASSLSLTVMWATANRRAVRAHPPLTGRAAAPYRWTPTLLADERGIGKRLVAPSNLG